MSKYQKVTVVFPARDNEVLLAMKREGFGAGWWNGFGGKVENESFDAADQLNGYFSES